MNVIVPPYIDLQLTDFKASCRVATTAAIALTGPQTIDGVAVVAGDRVLVKDQAAGQDNGIYVCAAGAWTRAADADASAKVTAGMTVPIEEGAVNLDKIFILTTNNPIVLGTTVLVLSPLSAGVTAHTALTDKEVAGVIDHADLSVTEAKLGALSVTEAKLGGQSVTQAKVAPTAISPGKIDGVNSPSVDGQGLSYNLATFRFKWDTIASLHKHRAASAWRNGNQGPITSGVWTKVQLNAEQFDVNGDFDDVTNYRYNVNVAGKKRIHAVVSFVTGGAYGTVLGVSVRRYNSSAVLQKEYWANNVLLAYFPALLSALMEANVGDYFELWAYHTLGSDNTIYGTYQYCWMSVTRDAD